MKKLTYLTAAASAILALTFTSSVYSQADSGSVPPLRGTPRILPLAMQERESPVINNITNTTTNVTQQIGGADLVGSTSLDVSNTGCGFGEGTAQWMLSCGKRRCEGLGYTSGNVVEYFGGSVTLACLR